MARVYAEVPTQVNPGMTAEVTADASAGVTIDETIAEMSGAS
jgi:multidrug resistance efflux pump